MQQQMKDIPFLKFLKHKIMYRSRRWLGTAVLYLVMFGLAFAFLYPFLYMLATSLKSNEDLNNFTIQWIPTSLHFQNFPMAVKVMDYFTGLQNSVIVTILSTAGQLISCSMAGYAFARYKMVGKSFLFFLVILALIIPAQTIIIPEYLLFANLGWINTHMSLVLPSFFGYGFKGAMYIFVFRQFYLGLPKELEEAAKVDGCGFIRTFIRVVFPVARSAYIVVLVLALVWHWSNYYEPTLFLGDSSKEVLSMSINGIVETLQLPADQLSFAFDISDNNVLNNATLMAGVVMTVAPIFIAFCFLQRQFIQGVERSGLTGE